MGQAALKQLEDPRKPGPAFKQYDVPLSSMMDVAPNGMALQMQNGSLPWYAVPGMFPQREAFQQQQAAQAAQAAMSQPPAASQGQLTPDQMQMLLDLEQERKLIEMINSAQAPEGSA
jgi:hypothetical protein